jgi:Bacterial protein of unknown function (DUF885)
VSSIADSSGRLRRVCDLDAAFLREYSGLHDDYDGRVADLSPGGIAAALGRLGGEPLDNPHDDAQLAATENAMRVRFGDLQQHRWDPWVHIEALDLSSYERPYADAATRAEARRQHLKYWDDVVDNAIESLDQLAAPVAEAFLGSVRGMAANITAEDGESGRAGLAALGRLDAHLARAAADGDPAPSLGSAKLIALLGCEDGLTVDLGALTTMADREYERMIEIRAEAAARLAPGRPIAEISAELRRDHGDFADVVASTQREVEAGARFARERDLLPVIDDECVVEPSPPARAWAPARVSWRAPWESRGHSLFHMAPPAVDWSGADRRTWLDRFNRAASSVVAVHEVAPGHCSHALMMARCEQPVRRTLWSELFFEGWAHYVEEMMWEEGYQAETARYQFAMAEEAMMRTIRVQAAIGIHTGQLSVADATALFEARTALTGAAARGEARRGIWEPTYVRYTWGKVLVRQLRETARVAWGANFSLARFHRELLSFGSPPVGLVPAALKLTMTDASVRQGEPNV